jgi:putative transposase
MKGISQKEFSDTVSAGGFPMKWSQFSESQIIRILKEAEAGVPVTDLCRRHGFSKNSDDERKTRYGGMEASDLRRLRELEEENRHLFSTLTRNCETRTPHHPQLSVMTREGIIKTSQPSDAFISALLWSIDHGFTYNSIGFCAIHTVHPGISD